MHRIQRLTPRALVTTFLVRRTVRRVIAYFFRLAVSDFFFLELFGSLGISSVVGMLFSMVDTGIAVSRNTTGR